MIIIQVPRLNLLRIRPDITLEVANCPIIRLGLSSRSIPIVFSSDYSVQVAINVVQNLPPQGRVR